MKTNCHTTFSFQLYANVLFFHSSVVSNKRLHVGKRCKFLANISSFEQTTNWFIENFSLVVIRSVPTPLCWLGQLSLGDIRNGIYLCQCRKYRIRQMIRYIHYFLLKSNWVYTLLFQTKFTSFEHVRGSLSSTSSFSEVSCMPASEPLYLSLSMSLLYSNFR